MEHRSPRTEHRSRWTEHRDKRRLPARQRSATGRSTGSRLWQSTGARQVAFWSPRTGCVTGVGRCGPAKIASGTADGSQRGVVERGGAPSGVAWRSGAQGRTARGRRARGPCMGRRWGRGGAEARGRSGTVARAARGCGETVAWGRRHEDAGTRGCRGAGAWTVGAWTAGARGHRSARGARGARARGAGAQGAGARVRGAQGRGVRGRRERVRGVWERGARGAEHSSPRTEQWSLGRSTGVPGWSTGAPG